MQFPIDVTVRMSGWRARLHLTDGAGRTIGFAPLPKGSDGRWPVFADERASRLIYVIRWENGLNHWFEDAQGRRLGAFGVVQGMDGKLVSVADEPRFRFVEETPGLDALDKWIPNLPFANALVGALVKPRVLAIRERGTGSVLRITKSRLMLDIRYTLHALDDVDGEERECLILGAIMACMQDHLLSFSDWIWRA